MGNSPEIELKKMSQELSVFGGSEKEFIRLYHESKQEPFDFAFLNIQDLTMRRNFEEKEMWNAIKDKPKNDDDAERNEEEVNEENTDEEK